MKKQPLTNEEKAMLKEMIDGQVLEYGQDDDSTWEFVQRMSANNHFTVNAWDEDGASYAELLNVWEYSILAFEVDGVFSVELGRRDFLTGETDHAFDLSAEYKTARGASNFIKKLEVDYKTEWNGIFYGENEG